MKLIKDMGIYMSAAAADKLIPFILLPFLTRVLNPEEYGMISIFTVICSMYLLFVGLESGGFVRVIYHKVEPDVFKSYVANVLVLFYFSAILVLSITFIFSDEISSSSRLDSKWIYLAFITGSLQYIFSLQLIIYQTKRKPTQYSILQLLKPFADIILVVVLVFYLSGDGEDRLLSIILSTIIAGAISIILLFKNNYVGFTLKRTYIKRVLLFSLPILPHSFALVAVFSLDKILLSSFLGLEIVGILAVSIAIASPTIIIAGAINRAFMPWSFQKFKNKENIQVVAASYGLVGLMFMVCLMYSIAISFLYKTIVGEPYHSGMSASVILVWAGFLKLIYFFLVKGIFYKENTKYMQFISVGVGILYLTLLVINVDHLTVSKIAVLMLSYHMVIVLFTLIYSQMVYPMPWLNYADSYIFIKNKFMRYGQ